MDFSALKIDEAGGEARFSVHARPRSKCSRIEGVRGGVLSISVRAVPKDGAANDELIEVLAESLAIPRRSVRLVRGGASRQKVVAVAGITASELRIRLSAANARA